MIRLLMTNRISNFKIASFLDSIYHITIFEPIASIVSGDLTNILFYNYYLVVIVSVLFYSLLNNEKSRKNK